MRGKRLALVVLIPVVLAGGAAGTWLFMGDEDQREQDLNARLAACETKVEVDGPGMVALVGMEQVPAIDVTDGSHDSAWPSVGEVPLLWRAKDGGAYAVDKAVFPEGLTVVDVTYLSSGDPVLRVGRVLGDLPPRELVAALIQAGVIQISIHVDAVAGLVEEAQGDARVYTSRWLGKAMYYTNERNVRFLDFVVRIDQGEILVAPPPGP